MSKNNYLLTLISHIDHHLKSIVPSLARVDDGVIMDGILACTVQIV